MKNLHKLAKSVTKEPTIGWIFGSLRYAILYRKRNIYRPNRTEVNFPKTAQPYLQQYAMKICIPV